MYHIWNMNRLLRYAALDAALILGVVILTHAGKPYFAAFQAGPAQDGIFLPVLMYHSITTLLEANYCITPETFQADLAYLSDNGYETVSAAQLVAYTQGTGTLPEHPVLLTFDDGFYNTLSLALPLLEQYNMCAVVSIVGNFTDLYAKDAPHNDVYSYLTWDDLQALVDSDRIEIGNHTYDMHSQSQRQGCAKQDNESEETYHKLLEEDLTQLQQGCQENLGLQPILFTYPYGFICDESKPVLRELGFAVTLTCLEQPNYITEDPDCLYGLGRYNRAGNCSTEEFMTRVLEEA